MANTAQHESVPLTPPEPPLQSLDSSWIISMREKIDQSRLYEPSSNLSIYRVPIALRKVDETIFTPQIVSLGPYHRDLPHLQDMNHHKWRALRHSLLRSGQDVSLYIEAARSLEGRARAFYETPLRISPHDFVESLVLDSIFVLQLFVGSHTGFEELGYTHNDPVFSKGNNISKIKRDMLMLENQLPMFVLDRIRAVQLGHELSSSDRVAILAIRFFDSFRPCRETDLEKLILDPIFIDGSRRALHCLDLFSLSILLVDPKLTSHCRIEGENVTVNNVTKLRDAGIEFRHSESGQFWDIRFKNGVLHIPRIWIEFRTKYIIHNLIAFEQCHFKPGKHIVSYFLLMDNLINTEVDVGYLRSKGIIQSRLGTDEEVADLFNHFIKECVFDYKNYYFSELANQVNRHCGRSWNAWRANLIDKYFKSPWTIISLAAAIILLILTFGQTFYAIYGYYKPY